MARARAAPRHLAKLACYEPWCVCDGLDMQVEKAAENAIYCGYGCKYIKM